VWPAHRAKGEINLLTIISPAKTLDFATPPPVAEFSIPVYLEKAQRLVHLLRGLSPEDIGRLMNISPKLAELNVQRFRDWHTPFTPANGRQALFAFRGDVYKGLDAGHLSVADIRFAHAHLRILSGLYGLLRPLDLIQPYRLEMGTRLTTPQGRNLYAFWGEAVTDALNASLAEHGTGILINLASNEYFRVIRPERLAADIITPVFRERKGDDYKTIGIHAKRARGMMARFIITERLDVPEGLKAFRTGGYAYNPDLSTDSDWVFTRG